VLIISVDGIEQIAGQIRGEHPSLQETWRSFHSGSSLGDWQSSELEDAFESWMFGWATEVALTTSHVLASSNKLQSLAEALRALDQQAASAFDAQFD
jgi:hypothetical protein